MNHEFTATDLRLKLRTVEFFFFLMEIWNVSFQLQVHKTRRKAHLEMDRGGKQMDSLEPVWKPGQEKGAIPLWIMGNSKSFAECVNLQPWSGHSPSLLYWTRCETPLITMRSMLSSFCKNHPVRSEQNWHLFVRCHGGTGKGFQVQIPGWQPTFTFPNCSAERLLHFLPKLSAHENLHLALLCRDCDVLRL